MTTRNKLVVVLATLLVLMLVLTNCAPASTNLPPATGQSSTNSTSQSSTDSTGQSSTDSTSQSSTNSTSQSSTNLTTTPEPTTTPTTNLHISPSSIAQDSVYRGTKHQTQRKLFRASTGTLVAIYRGRVTEQNGGLVMRYSRDNGQSWHDALQFCDNSLYVATGVMDEDNNIYVVYALDAIQDYGHGIYFRKFIYNTSSDNWTLGPQYLIGDDLPNTACTYPVIAKIGTRLWIAYRYYDGSGYSVVVRFGDPDADGDYPLDNWSPPLALTPTVSNPSTFPILVNYDSKLAAIYILDDNTIESRYLENPLLAPAEWSPESMVFPLGVQVYDARMTAVADDIGNIHLVYSYLNRHIVYSKYDGTSWSQRILLAGSQNDYASIATNGSDLWVFWEQDLGIDLNRIVYKKWTADAGWDQSPTVLAESFERYFDAVWNYHDETDTYTNETRHAASSDAYDVRLFADPGDILYMGHSEKFSSIRFTLSLPPINSPMPMWEYWNGTTWAPLTININADFSFTITDTDRNIRFTPPFYWEPTRINDYTGYYIRVKRTNTSTIAPVVATQISPVLNSKAPTAIAIDPDFIGLIWAEGAETSTNFEVKFSAVVVSPTARSPGKPEPPTGLVATPEDSTVTLKWNGNTELDLAGYKLYNATDHALIADVGRTLSYIDAGLANNTTYSYVLTAYDLSGNESEHSSMVNAMPMTDVVAPEIFDISVSDITNYSATISWTTDEPADSQIEYRSRNTHESYNDLDANLTLNHSMTIVGLNASNIYMCHVSSRDHRGNLVTSPYFNFTTASPEVNLIRYPYIQDCTLDTVTIVWLTDNYGDSVVAYGTTPILGSVASETTWTTQHAVRISGLKPNTTYYYRVLSNNYVLSEMATFHTNNDETDTTFTFLAFGDSGTGSDWQHDVAARISATDFDFAIHVGDVSQYTGEARDYEQYYFNIYRDIISKTCIYTCLGNHDVMTDYGAPYLEAFYLPSNNLENTERYYSFDYGNAHFIALDTNIDYTRRSNQLQWLRDDLSTNTKPWTIVFFHQPPYSTGTYGYDANIIHNICPLLEYYKVDLVFTGHDHNYQRFIPIDDVVYMVIGGGGDQLNPVEPDELTAYAESTHHIVVVNINGNTLKMEAVKPDGTVFDSLTLVK